MDGWTDTYIHNSNEKQLVNCEFIICHTVGKISLEKESSIQAFSEMYAVDQDLVVKYMHHLAYLEMMKRKRERERREKGAKPELRGCGVGETSS